METPASKNRMLLLFGYAGEALMKPLSSVPLNDSFASWSSQWSPRMVKNAKCVSWR